MRKTFDRRVVPDSVLDFVRACQVRIPCHLGGGAALAGVYLGRFNIPLARIGVARS